VVSSATLARVLEPQASEADDQLRERILSAALEQFRLVGLRRATVGEVARRAGVGRVTVYRRVGDKPELIAAAIQLEVQRVNDAVASAIAPLETAEARLVEAFVVGVRLVRSHPLLQRLLETEPEDLLPYLTLHFDPIIELARQFVAGQISAVDATPRDPELVGELLARLAQSLVLTRGGGIPVDDESRLRAFARAYLTPLLRT
jgi:AcrR family transcriptional regulator